MARRRLPGRDGATGVAARSPMVEETSCWRLVSARRAGEDPDRPQKRIDELLPQSWHAPKAAAA